MAKRRVFVEPEAERNIEIIFAWLAARSPSGAQRWYQAFLQAIESLETNADAYGLAPESRHFSESIRQIVFRTRRGHAYRALYCVRDSSDVRILYVRGPGQDEVEPDP